MKKKFLAATLVMAGALVLPTMAAQDTSGMRYTSASEGFYASLRVQFNSGGTDDAGAAIENSASRFGVRGTNDLGNGLEGFYQYEAGVSIDNGGGLSTRLGHVGLRGGFGELQVGSFWPASYNWVHGSTDVANWASGSFIHTMLLPGRQSRALEYTTPDISGFQVAIFIEMDPNRDGEGALAAAAADIPTTTVSISESFETNDISVAVIAYRAASALDREELLRRFLVAPATRMRNTVQINREDLVPASDEDGNSPYGIETTTTIDQSDTLVRTLDSDPSRAARSYWFDIDGIRAGNFFPINTVDPIIFGVRTFTDVPTTIPGDPRNPKDDNDIDLWSVSSKYSLQGFNAGVSYTVAPDGLAKSSGSRKDLALYALRLGYAQDNWYVSSWYAEDNAGDDVNRNHDTETFSLAAGVAVGKANLYALYETQESDNYTPEIPAGGGGGTPTPAVASTGTHDDEVATFGVQYNLGSRSRVWIEYVSRDYESDTDQEDYTNIGLRHDL